MISVIVIDYKKNNPLLRECLEHLQKQTYKNFEIILLTDYKNELEFPKLRKKSYGRYVGPAQKRDDGVKMAKGEIIAFIDDDA
ncbi:MAG: glycosyltransferase family A protein [Patescibacteria group bacterium]